MHKKILVLLATCAIAASSLPLAGCSAGKNQKAELLPAETMIAAPAEDMEVPEETETIQKDAFELKLEKTVNPSTNIQAANPAVITLASNPMAKSRTKKTVKRRTGFGNSSTKIDIIRKKASKPTKAPDKNITPNTNDPASDNGNTNPVTQNQNENNKPENQNESETGKPVTICYGVKGPSSRVHNKNLRKKAIKKAKEASVKKAEEEALKRAKIESSKKASTKKAAKEAAKRGAKEAAKKAAQKKAAMKKAAKEAAKKAAQKKAAMKKAAKKKAAKKHSSLKEHARTRKYTDKKNVKHIKSTKINSCRKTPAKKANKNNICWLG